MVRNLVGAFEGSPFFHARTLYSLPCAFLVAELFYKFGSFTLECAAFLLTWFCFDAVAQALIGKQRESSPQSH